MFEYLDDIEFLTKLDKLRLKTHYARIVLLTFDEKPIREIQGNITSGTLNVNGSSAIRRTISLTMLANEKNSDIENVENEISIKRKVKVFVGYKNTLRDYTQYGDIIWFPCGMFVLSSASVNRNTNGWTISISGKDKMCLLDGSVGGTLPGTTQFDKRNIVQADGELKIERPTIFQIIFEAVNHWGGEDPDNIIISDLDEKAKMLVRYMGSKAVYFTTDYTALSFTSRTGFTVPKTYGQDVGYEDTDFIYPEDLILKAGDTVVTLLDKIKSLLGNYEYFYDINGRFVFQQIKNYLNKQSDLTELTVDNYVKNYNNMKYLYSLTDLDTTTAITRNPKYDNLKNDFYVWGQRETASGAKKSIRYHLAIDTKPILDLALQYMWEVKDLKTGLIIRYYFTTTNNDYVAPLKKETYDDLRENHIVTPSSSGGSTSQYYHYYSQRDGIAIYGESLDDLVNVLTEKNRISTEQANIYSTGDYQVTLIGTPCTEWREELYRRALNAQVTTSVYNNYYDSELIAEWRNLYDPIKTEWQAHNGWNPAVFEDPGSLGFWLDFIDTSAAIGQYSINEIGRRTKVVNDTNIKSIYNQEVPDVVFIEGAEENLIANYRDMGQKFFILTPEYYDLFSISTTGTSCFDRIREMMYQNLSYNTTISLTCLPKYYMEVNNIIHIEDRESNINGDYQITQFSLPLTYNGVMSITATEVLTRI